MARILVVDDEAKLGRLAAEMLELDGHEVKRATGGRDALVQLASSPFDVVLTDLRMPEIDGFRVLQAARARPNAPDVVMMTAFGSTDGAVDAMKAGAADYVTKPFSMDELQLRIRRLAAQRDAEQQRRALSDRLVPDLVAESPAMQRVLASAKQVAASDASVLLLGESGTGKSQLARLIHYAGRRAARAFVEVHCAALPETLLESELFGHEKGAFTGALQKKAGLLAAADGGTLFLDEIGEVSLATQVKLLRFLQEREFVPVGANEARKVDVRIVAATNRDLEAALRDGTFREDFYYRINVVSIRVPSLGERPADVLPIAERFLARRGLPPERLTEDARRLLADSEWPGNVRELENALQRALVFAGPDPIRAEHFDGGGRRDVKSSGNSLPIGLLKPGFNLDDHERDVIHAALERANGNKSLAAKLLGITRRRLYSRLASLGEPAADAE